MPSTWRSAGRPAANALMPTYWRLRIIGREEVEMHLTVLTVTGCPKALLLEEQLGSALEGHPA